MPKNINKSLQRLESQVYSLLKIQQQQCTELQNLAPSYARIPENLTMAHMSRATNGSRSDARTSDPRTYQPYLQNSSYATTRTIYQPPQNTESNDMYSTEYMNYMEQYTAENSGTDLLPKCSCRKKSSKSRDGEKFSATRQQLLEEKERIQEASMLIEQLRNELSTSKNRMTTMSKDMNLLSKGLETLRYKYKNLKNARKETLLQMEDLKKINEQLCKKLENEWKNHFQSVKDIKERAVVELESKVKEQASLILCQSQQHHQKLQEANERLARYTQDFHRQLVDATTEAEQLRTELEEQTQQFEDKCQENESLKMSLANENNKNLTISKAIDMLEGKVQKMIAMEKKSNKEILSLKAKIRELEQTKDEFHQDNSTKVEECRMLKGECQMMQRKISDLNHQYAKRSKQIEDEMRKLQHSLKDKEDTVTKERNMLRELVQELSDVVKAHKKRINDLMDINKEQQTLLHSQSAVIRSKEIQLELAEKETESLKLKNQELGQEVSILQKTINILEHQQQQMREQNCGDFKKKSQLLQSELDNAKKGLEEEKDKVLLKEKIITDQTDTIHNLKQSMRLKDNEIKNMKTDLARVKQELDQEKCENQILLRDIDILENQKEKLAQQVAHLQNESQEPTDSGAEHRLENQLACLEGQVARKQDEWQAYCAGLIAERDDAVEQARAAMKHLEEAARAFEKQKKIQMLLMEIMREQNVKMKNTCQVIVKLKKMIRERQASEERLKDIIQDKAAGASNCCLDIINKIHQLENHS